jgi:LCP family protein required for cell wall assembly
MGKHGSLTDTMIFAHLDETKKTVDLISVPRDLYYKGRKINSYSYLYGMKEFTRALSDITGYQIDKYILIDMYAFIDVIDLIGGIDIHLDNAVIDPTYKTLDNGVWGTLHYEPGDYHLNGREALRLARSRHTSSDFERARRQHKILEAIQSKAKNLGFGDAATIYDIVKTVLGKTETDIGLTEAVQYYFKYQSFKINSSHVMTSGNILYVPPYTTKEQCAAKIADAETKGEPKPDCENDLDAYTLLPRDDNWNVIKWYFHEIFDGAGLDY